MKSISIGIVLLLFSSVSFCQTPNWNELFRQKKTQRRYLVKQIALLKLYLNYLKKGYEIVDKGLTTIGDIKDGKYTMDKNYIGSLQSISPVVRDSPLLEQIMGYQKGIVDGFAVLIQHVQADENFTGEEITAIQAVRSGILDHCDRSMDELEIVATAGQSEMTDDERLTHLAKIHQELQTIYTFTQDFVQETKLLSVQRTREKNDINMLRKLYGI